MPVEEENKKLEINLTGFIEAPKRRHQQFDFGVELPGIDVSDKGELLFADEIQEMSNRRRTRNIFSNHECVLSNSRWTAFHRAMNKRFDDTSFDLNDKKKNLFSINGEG